MSHITLIAAMDNNRGIGRNGSLPWSLPADLARFKKLTMHKPLIMGRKTCVAIGRALPGRTSIVLSHYPDLHLPDNCQAANTVQQALRLAEQACLDLGSDEIMLIGGAQIYRLFLPLATRLELSWVHTDSQADCFFPDLNLDQWLEDKREERPADTRNPYDLSFVRYRRA